ncbi:MAG: amidohydrolase family protein [Acidobacteriota bacterium]|nr:amidohydrolase [Bryobacteraceae bacterium CoA2 C42]MCA2965164.1 amidohydrolase family protein [Acidobacteriaceae bacterium]
MVRHPLVRSVYGVAPNRLPEGLALEWPADRYAEVSQVRDRRVALDGVPETEEELPGNFYLKLTGFSLPVTAAGRERMARAMRLAGPERVMFASGWPAGGVSWKERLAAFTQSLGPLPMGVREQILGGTAAEFYGL